MLPKLPDGVDPLLACGVADNISDGYRAVGPHLKERPGGTVLVVGLAPPGSIGLYAAGIAVAMGAEKVVYADADPERLEIAAALGAEPLPPRWAPSRFPLRKMPSRNTPRIEKPWLVVSTSRSMRAGFPRSFLI